MRDTAALAAQSDPNRNFAFSRTWRLPSKRRSPALTAISNRAKDLGNFSADTDTRTDLVVQRAITAATRRAADLDRRAKLLRLVGLRDAADRAEVIAERIRTEVLQ